jgi:hypothetical protein
MGNLRQRGTILGALRALPHAVVASDDEVMSQIEREALHGLGIGYVDAHLLTSTRLSRDATLWTRDRRLGEIASRMGLNAGL